MKHAANTVLATFMMTLLMTATGMDSHAAKKLYRWVDENGKVYYSDKVPPAESKQERTILNEQGRKVDTLERAKTDEEHAKAKHKAKLEKEKRRRAAEQASYDRMLLMTYHSEEDLFHRRDSNLLTIDNLIHIAQGTIENQENELQDLQQQAADHERSGRPVPEYLLQKINLANDKISYSRKYIDERNRERHEVLTKFKRDLKRYRELR